jgi:cytochrome c-type biogenesis protein CcmH/NrfF
MLLGHLSANLLWLWFIGAFVLGAVLVYGVTRAGRLRRSERARLDRNTEARQQQEDPYKRPT